MDKNAEKEAAQRIDQDVARRIAEARAERDMSYAELAAAVGVTPTAAWHWANGTSAVSVGRIVQLARVLDKTPAWLAFGEEADDEYLKRRWEEVRDNQGLTDLEEVYVSAAPKLLRKRSWSVSRAFLNKTAGASEVPCFLFEMRGQASGHFRPGDFLICTQAIPEKPEDLEAGYYLFFAPYVPEVVHITVGYKQGVIYSIRQGNQTCEAPASEVVLLGKIVGTIKKLSNENIMGD